MQANNCKHFINFRIFSKKCRQGLFLTAIRRNLYKTAGKPQNPSSLFRLAVLTGLPSAVSL